MTRRRHLDLSLSSGNHHTTYGFLKSLIHNQNDLYSELAKAAKRQEQTEADIRFVSLMNRALMEIFLQQGATTKEALTQLMQRLDREADDDYDGVRPLKLAESVGFPKPGPTNAQRLKRAEKATKEWARKFSVRRRSANRPQF